MMHIVDEVAEAKARLLDYVARRGSEVPTPAAKDGRRGGWLLRDITTVVNEANRLSGLPPMKPKSTWAQVWALFDKRKTK